MRKLGFNSCAIVIAALVMALPSGATDATIGSLEVWKSDPTTIFDASEVELEDFLWEARPIIVFADTPQDPAFRRQIDLLKDRMEELVDRDVVLITDTSRAEPSELRRKLRPRGFMLTLIGKDGGIKLRKPFPWDVRELSRSIDKMPMRQQELRDQRLGE